MFYLCLTFSALWSVVFVYLSILDHQIKDIGRRLSARTTDS